MTIRRTSNAGVDFRFDGGCRVAQARHVGYRFLLATMNVFELEDKLLSNHF